VIAYRFYKIDRNDHIDGPPHILECENDDEALVEAGDAANVILYAVGYNFRRILAWPRDLLRFILAALIAAISFPSALQSTS
jgi:hypothetical protein